jgi:hypothetical protein
MTPSNHRPAPAAPSHHGHHPLRSHWRGNVPRWGRRRSCAWPRCRPPWRRHQRRRRLGFGGRGGYPRTGGASQIRRVRWRG